MSLFYKILIGASALALHTLVTLFFCEYLLILNGEVLPDMSKYARYFFTGFFLLFLFAAARFLWDLAIAFDNAAGN